MWTGSKIKHFLIGDNSFLMALVPIGSVDATITTKYVVQCSLASLSSGLHCGIHCEIENTPHSGAQPVALTCSN